MKTSEVLLCGLLVILCITVECSSQDSADGRILGGQNATLTQYNYMVSLRDLEGNHYCSGFVHTNRWVITTAHCVSNRNVSEFTMDMGTISRTETLVRHTPIRVIVHPEFNPHSLNNNIAVIQTNATIGNATLVGSLAISTAEIAGNVNATVAGWGNTSANGTLAGTLQFLNVTTITRDECLERHHRLDRAFIFNSTLCTVAPVGQGICSGDGGSPLVIPVGTARQAIGIASWNAPCGSGLPEAYVRLSSYQSWISAAIIS